MLPVDLRKVWVGGIVAVVPALVLGIAASARWLDYLAVAVLVAGILASMLSAAVLYVRGRGWRRLGTVSWWNELPDDDYLFPRPRRRS